MHKTVRLPALHLAAMLVLLMATAVALGGCASKRSRSTEGGEEASTTSTTDPSASTSGADSAPADFGGEGVTGPQGGLLAQRIIYFDFDRSDIRPDFVDVIAAHGRYLAGNAGARVRLEGHSDERGSREYNIGLGERRGQAVRRALALQGVAETQVATVSYGEERPSLADSTEEAWTKNRRVEIVYLQQ